MSSSPHFSVITVCRNEESQIRLTCESLCGQSFSDFEWIVIDGGSTDGTLKILEEYADQISVMISEPDQGIYDAMNKGIARATGQYLVFMNGGDQFADESVLQAVAAAPQEAVIYGDVLLMNEGGRATVKGLPAELPKNYFLKGMIPHQAAYFRKELFEQYGMYDTSYSICADYDLFVRLIHVAGVHCSYVSKPLSVFRMDGVSSTATGKALRKQERHRVRMKYFRHYRYSMKAIRQIIRNRLNTL